MCGVWWMPFQVALIIVVYQTDTMDTSRCKANESTRERQFKKTFNFFYDDVWLVTRLTSTSVCARRNNEKFSLSRHILHVSCTDNAPKRRKGSHLACAKVSHLI